MKKKKHFLNINWGIRFLNPSFIFAVGKSLIIALVTYAGMKETEITSWPALWSVILGVLSHPVMLLNVADSVYNAIIDFTVKGNRDSKLTLEKTEATDPRMSVVVEGDEGVDSASDILVENEEPKKEKINPDYGPERWKK